MRGRTGTDAARQSVRSTPTDEPSQTGSSVPASSGRPRRLRRHAVLLGIVLALAVIEIAGLPYYTASIGERLRSPLHAWFKPSGYVGQTVGIIALLAFLFMWLYPLRKRYRWLAFTGAVGRWLDVHIVVGLLLPVLGATHAGWRFQGLIGLGYTAMLLVSARGIVGRYLYTRIPRSRSGLELGREEVELRRRQTITRIAVSTGLDPREVDASLAALAAPRGGLGTLATFGGLFAGDLARWRSLRALERRWCDASTDGAGPDRRSLKEALRLARRQVALNHQVRMLDATQRVFRLWHVAHRPIAITALAAILIHVSVAIALGVTWLW